jgi:exonuclease SbcC
MGDTTSQLKDLEDKTSELEAKLKIMVGERALAETKAEELGTDLEDLGSLEGQHECPRCRQPLTKEHLHDMLAKDKKEMRRHSSKARELAAKSRKMEARIEGLRTDLKSVVEAGRRRAVVEDRLAQAREESALVPNLEAELKALALDELKTKLVKAKGEVDEGRHRKLLAKDAERRDIARQLKAIASLASEVEELGTDVSKAKDHLRNSQRDVDKASKRLDKALKVFDEGALEQARRDHEVASRTVVERRTELRGVERRIEMANDQVTDRLSRVEVLDGHLRMARVHDDLHRWLTKLLRPALEDIELTVLSMMHDEMDAAAKGWFERLVDDPDLELEVDEEFVPTVIQQGYDVSVNTLSGGERTAVAFAYRLALNGLVQRIAIPGQANLLMLDEPTDGFSKEQLIRMGGVLQDVEAQQVVIVSHNSELESFAARVFVVRKEGGASLVTTADQ